MKALYILFAGCLLFTACTKNSEGVITQVVTPQYPKITMKGGPNVVFPIGGTYTDPGATSFDSAANKTTDLTPVSQNVNTAEGGVYTVNYHAVNSYGYQTNATRHVLISNYADAADDISGTYKRSTNGVEITVTKVATGLYVVENPGGVANDPNFVFPFYIGFLDRNTFVGTEQNTPLGAMSFKNTSIIRGPGSAVTLKWVVINNSFGTSVRTFNKE
ncbi:uncharacterized protein DUF5011 [Chitinophaga polysaccharea]|uniref:Uncharacterized protein DUF5011 n=1 Tax=Chitinophaga polysaccharea TaxID=1293035 RepID=A0A561Q448_9BACT|nr:immunoglobulin-like domain-containing protein [Chitinophaga polysaccharea]TWF45137.1 uncharacterized protein DUF5011 [Chitinophaga polysaccharea]